MGVQIRLITYKIDDIFNSKTEAIVNTVNLVGVMGRGIAKEFKSRYPEMYQEYREKCDNDNFKIGELFIYPADDRIIVNFPTKRDWRNKSKMEDIVKGLNEFVKVSKSQEFKSISFPALGCGNGGLKWPDVKKQMEYYLNQTDLDIEVYLSPFHYMEELIFDVKDKMYQAIEKSDKIKKLYLKKLNTKLEDDFDSFANELNHNYKFLMEIIESLNSKNNRDLSQKTLKEFFAQH